MTPDDFRGIALGFPEAAQASHMGHPDFRVAGKIFATLGSPDETFGMVKLTPEQQGVLLSAEPAAFRPAAGAWGRRGCTLVLLHAVDAVTLRSALTAAWKATAPKKLLAAFEAGG